MSMFFNTAFLEDGEVNSQKKTQHSIILTFLAVNCENLLQIVLYLLNVRLSADLFPHFASSQNHSELISNSKQLSRI